MSYMYICDTCDKPTPNYSRYISGPVFGKEGYSECDDCRKKYDRERVWENEQWHKDEITCPWCGHEETDSWEFDGEYDDEYECEHCGRPFVLERVVDITYTSKRRIEDMPEGWAGDGE